jgi:hypothetical protein
MEQGSNGTAMLTDEQILDMEPLGNTRDHAARNESGVILSGAKDLSGENGAETAGEILRHSVPQNDSARDMALLDDATGVIAAEDAAVAGAAVADRAQTNTAGDPARIAMENGKDPAWLTSLEAQPQGGREAAAEARAWRAAATDVASLDAAYFSADAGARSGLAARLYDSDPAAFRAMLAESARMMSQRDPQGLAELARELGAAPSAAVPLIAASPRTLLNAINNSNSRSALTAANSAAPLTAANRNEGVAGNASLRTGSDSVPPQQQQNRQYGDWRSQEAAAQQQLAPATPPAAAADDAPNAANRGAFPAEAYRSFEAATNEDVARRVHRAIDHTLSTTLPDGMAEGARRRIAEDIFQEVHASLAADRDLGRRLGETLRDWRFDAAARQQVSSLLAGRARAVLPEVARRVVAEWTSSVLASDRAKTARIDAATSRRDITGGRLPEPVPASSLRPRNIDYHRVSDEQIMEM